MRTKKPAVAVLATAALLSLAACGGGSGNDSASAGSSFQAGGGAGSGKDATLSGPAAIPADAAKGGTLTVLSAATPATLDPTRAYYTDSTAILSGLVVRSLTQYVYENGKMVLAPDMATDLGRHNSNNTSWTFTLKKGLKFEDGTPVTAQDVAYAVERNFAAKELPNGPVQYAQTFFLDGDKYKGPFSDKSAYKGVSVSGQSITIKMRRPFADMDYYASFPAFSAIPKGKDDPTTYGNHPLATGPYKFADYKPGTELKLVKNDQWDPKTDPGRLQLVDGWDFKFAQDQSKEENIIINDTGNAQTTLSYDNVSAPSFRQMQAHKDRIAQGTSPCTYMWFLDMTKIKNVNVRKAIGYAYPYENAWKAAGLVVGVTRVPGTSILPPGTAGRVNYDALGIQGKNTDPAKSRALLAKAGYKPGQFVIRWPFSADDANAVAAKNEIVKGLKAGGFNPQPIASSLASIRDVLADDKSPENVRPEGWCSDWPDGGSWFPAQWAGSLVGVAGMPNPANFKEPDMDAEQTRILDKLSPADAVKAWGEFDKTMETKYYPAVVTGYDGVASIHGSKVGGMVVDSVRGMPLFSHMYITK